MRAWMRGVLPFLVVVLGAGEAQAASVTFDPENDRKAIAVTNLGIGGVFYNITFAEDLRPIEFYGDPPGTYTFNNVADATAAVEAINLVLNDEDPLPLWVGVEGGATDEGTQEYLVGYGRSEPLEIGVLNAVVGQNLFLDEWRDNEPLELPVYAGDDLRTFAVFTLVTAAPEISVMPESLTPATLITEDATDSEIFVANSGGGTLDYVITVETDMQQSGLTWLSVSQSSGSLLGDESDPITVSYSTASLPAGVYDATITVADSADLVDPQTVVVTLLVATQSVISLSETMFMPKAPPGTDPLPDSFTVLNAGGQVLYYDVSVDVPWMSVDPESGLSVSGPGTPDTIDVLYDTSSLTLGTHEGAIEVTAPLAVNNPQTIDVVLTIDAAGTLDDTQVQQRQKVNTIPGLDYSVSGTYDKPGFNLILPKSGITGNTVFHDGGAHTFTTPASTVTYGNWTFEIRSTCAADGDPCLVQTDNGTPWALRNVDLTAGTAVIVFTQSGADAFNALADGDPDFHFQEEEAFGTALLVPEPSLAALSTAALTTLGFIRLASRRRRRLVGAPPWGHTARRPRAGQHHPRP